MPTTDLQTLTVRECLALLRSVPVGRLVFTENALPAIRPVNFTVADGHVVIRTKSGSWADRLDRAVVAFEVDKIDIETHLGWSVVVLGKAELARRNEANASGDPAEEPWPPGHHDRVLKVAIEHITGRRLALSSSAGSEGEAVADSEPA